MACGDAARTLCPAIGGEFGDGSMDKEDVVDLLGERAGTYRLLARLFFKPLTQEEIDGLAGSEFAQTGPYSRAVEDEACTADDGRNDIARYLRRRNTGTREELACDFTGAFYGVTTVEGRSAMPYESLFRCGEEGALLMGVPRGEMYREFKANRVRVPEGVDIPEDHLSFMFDYLALLCDRTAECARRGDLAGAQALLGKQETFLRDHVESWYPQFRELAERVVQTRFYRGCLKLVSAFLESEPAEIACLRDELAA